MPTFKCKDIGMDYPFEAKAKSHEELMKMISTHAATAHKMTSVPPDMMKKIKAAIKP
jgi:predicted small metal-binding protein